MNTAQTRLYVCSSRPCNQTTLSILWTVVTYMFNILFPVRSMKMTQAGICTNSVGRIIPVKLVSHYTFHNIVFGPKTDNLNNCGYCTQVLLHSVTLFIKTASYFLWETRIMCKTWQTTGKHVQTRPPTTASGDTLRACALRSAAKEVVARARFFSNLYLVEALSNPTYNKLALGAKVLYLERLQL